MPLTGMVDAERDSLSDQLKLLKEETQQMHDHNGVTLPEPPKGTRYGHDLLHFPVCKQRFSLLQHQPKDTRRR